MVLDYKIKTLRRLFGPNAFFRVRPVQRRGGDRRGSGGDRFQSPSLSAAGADGADAVEPTAYLRSATKPKITKGGNGIPRAFFNEQLPRMIKGKSVGRQLWNVHLLEKQKMRLYYGAIRDGMFRRYVDNARSKRFNVDAALLRSLELRFDTLLYRTGMVCSPMQARHWIAHGHVLVNGEAVRRRCASLKVGDVISIADDYFENALVAAKHTADLRKALNMGSGWIVGNKNNTNEQSHIPWLENDRIGLASVLVSTPEDADLRIMKRAALFPYIRDAALDPHAAMRAYR